MLQFCKNRWEVPRCLQDGGRGAHRRQQALQPASRIEHQTTRKMRTRTERKGNPGAGSFHQSQTPRNVLGHQHPTDLGSHRGVKGAEGTGRAQTAADAQHHAASKAWLLWGLLVCSSQILAFSTARPSSLGCGRASQRPRGAFVALESIFYLGRRPLGLKWRL